MCRAAGKTHALAVLQIQDPERGSGQVGNGSLEKFVARIGVKDVHERFATMPFRLHMRTGKNL